MPRATSGTLWNLRSLWVNKFNPSRSYHHRTFSKRSLPFSNGTPRAGNRSPMQKIFHQVDFSEPRVEPNHCWSVFMLFTISISYYFQYFFNLKTLTCLTKRNPTSRASLAGFETKYKHVEIEFVGEFNFKIGDSIGGFKSSGSDSNPNSCFVIVIAEFWGGIDCVVVCCWFRYVCDLVMIL